MMSIEKGWHKALEKELQEPYLASLKEFLKEEKEQGFAIFPPEEEVFNALRQTPLDRVKVVLMGQDPYHGVGQAHGLCFSVHRGISIPPSLKNIYKEMENDLGIPRAQHGFLLHWAKQGVLMLNATLTVRQGCPKSHYGKGWERFTDSVIRILAERSDPIVFILWGKSAQEKCESILSNVKHPHAVLTAAHPSPYSADRFFGCRHFSKTNHFLEKCGKAPISWAVDG